jgi:hypothetical protein
MYFEASTYKEHNNSFGILFNQLNLNSINNPMLTATADKIKLLIPAGGFTFIVNFHHNLIMRQDTISGARPTNSDYIT